MVDDDIVDLQRAFDDAELQADTQRLEVSLVQLTVALAQRTQPIVHFARSRHSDGTHRLAAAALLESQQG